MKQAKMLKPKRARIGSRLATGIEFANDRKCCVCKAERLDIQLHHIDRNPANNDEGNLAILCLQCHSEAERTSGLGRDLSPLFVKRSKIDWEQRVAVGRKNGRTYSQTSKDNAHNESDEMDIDPGSEVSRFEEISSSQFDCWLGFWKAGVLGAEIHFDRPAVQNPSSGIDSLIFAIKTIFEDLASYYPKYTFGRDGGAEQFDSIFDSLLDFELQLAQNLRGMQGQYSYVNCGLRVIRIFEKIILDTIELVTENSSDSSSVEFTDFKTSWTALSQQLKNE